jgi:hypothetical protein
VVIEWDAPFNNYKPILEYDIIFLTSQGSYINIDPECSGTNPSQTYCSVEMSKIRTETGLTRDALIVARVRARNENGWDAFS